LPLRSYHLVPNPAKHDRAFISYKRKTRHRLALPYAERTLKSDLSKIFEVKGIPTLILLSGHGKQITKNGSLKCC
jgi:thioredoxin-related protein